MLASASGNALAINRGTMEIHNFIVPHYVVIGNTDNGPYFDNDVCRGLVVSAFSTDQPLLNILL